MRVPSGLRGQIPCNFTPFYGEHYNMNKELMRERDSKVNQKVKKWTTKREQKKEHGLERQRRRETENGSPICKK